MKIAEIKEMTTNCAKENLTINDQLDGSKKFKKRKNRGCVEQ